MPKVSVIVPVYNVEKYLGKCIDSILNQTFSDFEIILVDDGSPDNSGAICDEYAKKDDRIKVIHKTNGGVSSARNDGISEANGDYIMFVDSDDFIEPQMLEAMLPTEDEDIIFCGFRYVYDDRTEERLIESFCLISKEEFINKYYIDSEMTNVISGPYNKLFKKAIIDENNIKFNQNISICEDGLFVVEFMQKAAKFSNIGTAYYNYVQYCDETLMSRYNSNAFDACTYLYQGKKKFVESGDSGIKKYTDMRTLDLFLTFLSQIYSRSGMGFWEKYKKIKKELKNECFVFLISSEKCCGIKNKLIRFSMKFNFFLPLHILYSVRWMKK